MTRYLVMLAVMSVLIAGAVIVWFASESWRRERQMRRRHRDRRHRRHRP